MKTKANPLKYFMTDLSFSKKLMTAFLILLLIPSLAVSVLIYGEINDLVVTDTIESAETLSLQTAQTVGNVTGKIKNVADILSNDSYLREIAMHPAFSHTDNIEYSGILRDSFMSSVSSLLDDPVIKNVRIYLDTPYEDLYEESGPYDIFQSMSLTKGSYWGGIMSTNETDSLYCAPFYLSNREKESLGTLSYVRRIRYEMADDKDTATAAYLVIYFSSESLSDLLMTEEPEGDAVNYILNDRDNLIAASDEALAGTYFLDNDDIDSLIGEGDTFVKRTVLGQELYTGFYDIEDTGWRLISVIPAAPLTEKSRSILLRYALIYALSVLIAVITALFLGRSISSRIGNVIKKMERTHHSKVHKIKEESGHDEIGDFVLTYNHMADEINDLMERQKADAEQIKTSEFNALQAQINPHFLYNTLDMINWLSLSDEKYRVSDAVQSLSKFYKLTLSKKKTIDTVENELEHVSLYVKLQNMRFDNKIDFIVDVPDNLMHHEIPKLTFQPVVENAILHGILEREEKRGTIVLTAWVEDDDILFLISDDGVGMDEETLNSILTDSPAESRSKSGSNIGIYNTHKRLNLLYGQGYGLSYSSTPGQGTEVRIRIPLDPHHES
ncbi:MAG: sensor histidine kinase [Lachnospiraceae bacterium]|nr:sensor histidine kinase [Lachnospiraceae bacterium]